MARSNNSDADVRVAADKLAAKIAELRIARDTLAEQRATVVIRRTQSPGDEAAVADAQTLGAKLAEVDAELEETQDALDRVLQAQDSIAQERAAGDKAAIDKRASENARKIRQAAKAIDDALGAVAAAKDLLFETISRFYQDADGAIRGSDAFQEIVDAKRWLPGIVSANLAHHGVLPATSFAYDAGGAAPTVQDRFENGISAFAAGPGRPSKPSDDSSGAAVDPNEDAVRAAIEQDIAA